MGAVSRQLTFLAALLLVALSSRGQSVTIGIDGLNRFGHLRNVVDVQGPLPVIDHTHYYDYGVWASYEQGRNGVRIGVHSFSYATNLMLNGGGFNISATPNTLGLYSLAYQRNILALVHGRLNMYAVAGVSYGRYHYTRFTTSPGSITMNGVTVFENQTRPYSEYARATVLIPSLRLEAAYSLGKHVRVGAWIGYDCANYLGAFKPLDATAYRYTTSTGTGSGTLFANGSGFTNGLSLHYAFSVDRRPMTY